MRGGSDRRRVDHHAVDGVADALVVEGRHRQRVDALEETRAVEVVQILRETDRVTEIDPAEEPASEREAGIGFVLAARLGVVAAGENGVGLVLFARARAERADQQQQRDLQRGGPAEDPERCRPEQQLGEGADEERVGRGVQRDSLDHVIDHDLARPRNQHQRQQAGDQQRELHREARAERRRIAKHAAQRLRRRHAVSASRALLVSVSTSRR
ncbi:MAG: hypothetical protein NTZ61_12025 [Proteobacteria bacterium]|nr:hypothetical protein [Pseudomonadota bacterium]